MKVMTHAYAYARARARKRSVSVYDFGRLARPHRLSVSSNAIYAWLVSVMPYGEGVIEPCTLF